MDAATPPHPSQTAHRLQGLLGAYTRGASETGTRGAFEAETRGINDLTARDGMWRRFPGNDRAAFDALPAAVRRRLHEHAYDAWTVNALMLWRAFRRRHACSVRAANTLLRYLDDCERLERDAFAAGHARGQGTVLPHVAASASVLRYARRADARGPKSHTARHI